MQTAACVRWVTRTWNMYAGPDPLTPTTASMLSSDTSIATPHAASRSCTTRRSASPACAPRQYTEAPWPTRMGVLGMTRITAVPSGNAASSCEIVHPAAIETIVCLGVMWGESEASTGAR